MENLYNRQSKILLNIPETATVVGCGGTGAWIGIILAMSGVKNIVLYDMDIIEEHNLNRLPYTNETIKVEKTAALKDFILSIRPSANVICCPEFCEISSVSGVIFDCTDAIKVQELIKSKCKENGTDYVRCGCAENHITVDSDVEPDEWSDTKLRGYDVVPTWAGTAVLSAAMSVIKYYLAIPDDISIYINDLFKSASKGISGKHKTGLTILDLTMFQIIQMAHSNGHPIMNMLRESIIKLRSVHGDTAVNNLLNVFGLNLDSYYKTLNIPLLQNTGGSNDDII